MATDHNIKDIRKDSHFANTLPADIDFTLREYIRDAVAQKGMTYGKLHTAIADDVSSRFEKKRYLVDQGVLSEKDLADQAKMQTPNKTYIHDYAHGGALCLRYTNSIANYFGVNYTVSAFDPADDLVQTLSLNGDL